MFRGRRDERFGIRVIGLYDDASLLPVLFELAIAFILTFALNKAPRQQPQALVSLRV